MVTQLPQVDDLQLGELDFEQFLELVLKRTDKNLVSVFQDIASHLVELGPGDRRGVLCPAILLEEKGLAT